MIAVEKIRGPAELHFGQENHLFARKAKAVANSRRKAITLT